MHNAPGYPQLVRGRWFLPTRPEKLEAAGNGPVGNQRKRDSK